MPIIVIFLVGMSCVSLGSMLVGAGKVIKGTELGKGSALVLTGITLAWLVYELLHLALTHLK